MDTEKAKKSGNKKGQSNPNPDQPVQAVLIQDTETIEAEDQLEPTELPKSFDELITREVSKFDAIVPKVEELKKQYLPLVIKDINDKEGYSAVTTALKDMVSKRTGIENKRKELKADSLKYGKAVDDRAKELQGLIEPIETHLANEKAKIDKEKKEIEERELAAKAEQLKQRQLKMTQLGFSYSITSNEYIWAAKYGEQEETLFALNLETFSDESFDDFCKQSEARNERVAIAEKAEKERLEREQKEQEEKAEQLKKEQEELEEQKRKMEKEREDMLNDRADIRRQNLLNRGAIYITATKSYVYGRNPSKYVELIKLDDIRNMAKDEWEAKFAEIEGIIEQTKITDQAEIEQEQREEQERIEKQQKQAKERGEREAKEKYRVSVMQHIGLQYDGAQFFFRDINFHWTDIVCMEDDEFEKQVEGAKQRMEEIKAADLAEKNRKEKAQREQQEQQQKLENERLEKERLSNLSDSAKLAEYIKAIDAIAVPEVSTAKHKNALLAFIQNIHSFKKLYVK